MDDKKKTIRKRVFAAALAAGVLCTAPAASYAADQIRSRGNFVFLNGEAAFYSSDLNYLDQKVEEQISNVDNGKETIVRVIREKGDTPVPSQDNPTFEQIADAIQNIGGKGTAVAGDVLYGKTFYDGDGYTTGTMQNFSGQTQNLKSTSISVSGANATVTMPETGYYNTGSKLTFPVSTIVNEAVQLTGTATADKVLSGNTFYGNNLTKKSGTMTDHSGTSQTSTVSVSGTTGTIPIPTNGYYSTSSSLSVDLGSYTRQVENTTRQATFKRIGNASFGGADPGRTTSRTIDCTGISGWQDLRTDSFFIVPTSARVYYQSKATNAINTGGSLGNLNDPDKRILSYDSSTGILTVYGNGTFLTQSTDGDVFTLWYDALDIYLWRK